MVGEVLRSYADRGVFRGFADKPFTRGRAEFRFLWLHETPFRLVLDTRTRTLTFRDLLPNVPYTAIVAFNRNSVLRISFGLGALVRHFPLDLGRNG